jgi:ribonuclease HII
MTLTAGTRRTRPGWRLERELWRAGALRVAGVDEVGRGPLAGPVVAAAVVLPRRRSGEVSRASWIGRLRDSKQLSAARREELAAIVREQADYGIGTVSAQVIDQINILRATRLAMWRAVSALGEPADALIVDGRDVVDGGMVQRAEVKADERCASVAAASIVAKVARDRMMCELDERFPGYGLAIHKGYGTALHMEALERLGSTTIHRLSFAPVRAALCGARTGANDPRSQDDCGLRNRLGATK